MRCDWREDLHELYIQTISRGTVVETGERSQTVRLVSYLSYKNISSLVANSLLSL